jgi:hypothetical protein
MLLPFLGKSQTPTWSEHIAPILYENCTSCHHSGGIAPFALLSYSDAYSMRAAIAHSVQDRHMPPWPPDPGYRHLMGERLLSQNEISMIVQWAQQGAPSGDIALAPQEPVYNGGPQLADADQVLAMPSYVSQALSNDEYRCFVVPSGANIDRFISAYEIVPGTPSIVHHVLVYQDDSGECAALDAADPAPGYSSFGGVGSNNAKLIGGWVPGSSYSQLPDGFGIRLKAGADVVIQVHYPQGAVGQQDQTSVRFRFDSSPGIREVNAAPILNHVTSLVNGPLYIPANTTRTFQERFTMPLSGTLISVSPHMHLIGDSMIVYAILPSQDTVPLIRINQWDFHWQGGYRFQYLQPIPAGSVLEAFAHYDNTSNNPHNPNFPPEDVWVGEATTDEMMLVYFQFTAYQNGDETILQDSSLLQTGTLPLMPGTGRLELFPSPAHESFSIGLHAPGTEEAVVELWDMAGKCVQQRTISLSSGPNSLPVTVAHLPEGVYYVVVRGKAHKWMERVLVVH